MDQKFLMIKSEISVAAFPLILLVTLRLFDVFHFLWLYMKSIFRILSEKNQRRLCIYWTIANISKISFFRTNMK